MPGLFSFLLSQLSLLLFGLAFFFHPAVRRRNLLVRLSIAFVIGAVILTVTATLLSLFGISWGERTLPIPALLLAAYLIPRWRRRVADEPAVRWRPSAAVAVPMFITLLIAFGVLWMSAWYGTMASVDFVLFWAPKAAHFAAARGLDPEFLRSPFSIHTHANYPQLFPLTLVWSSLLTGDAMFRYGVLTAPLWMLFSFPALLSLLREAMDDTQALVCGTLWFTAISASLAASMSGGNAEAPLLVYGALALIGLLVERNGMRSSYARLCVFIGLSGLLMTKVEGLVAFAFLLLGWSLREVRTTGWLRNATRLFLPPLAMASSWWLFQLVRAIPMTDAVREGALEMSFSYVPQIVRGMLTESAAGTFGLSWIIPLIFLAVAWRRWGRVAPALFQVAGTLAFLGFYYHHAHGDPSQLILWTMSRVSQPALSAAIFAAAFVNFDRRRP
jgi:hypothetical protein